MAKKQLTKEDIKGKYVEYRSIRNFLRISLAVLLSGGLWTLAIFDLKNLTSGESFTLGMFVLIMTLVFLIIAGVFFEEQED